MELAASGSVGGVIREDEWQEAMEAPLGPPVGS